MLVEALTVGDRGRTVRLTFDELLRHHGGGSPGGVAHAFKALQRGLPLLSPDAPCERRAVAVRTAFAGPGARDAFKRTASKCSSRRWPSA